MLLVFASLFVWPSTPLPPRSVKITFLGTGTSQGIPVIACPCEVCKSKDARDKRLRCSILIETDDQTLVVDTGPDFRQQMLRGRVRALDGVLLTHLHKDHIAGLDDVRAFNFRQKKPMPIWADPYTIKQLHNEYPYIFDGSNYPGIPKVDIHEIPLNSREAIKIGSLKVEPVPVMHYKLPVNGFKMGTFAYVTDASEIPEESMAQLEGLDVLVLNALRKERHISHFNLEQALEVIKLLKPKKAFLTHISHLMGRHDEITGHLPDGVHMAFDELKFMV